MAFLAVCAACSHPLKWSSAFLSIGPSNISSQAYMILPLFFAIKECSMSLANKFTRSMNASARKAAIRFSSFNAVMILALSTPDLSAVST